MKTKIQLTHSLPHLARSVISALALLSIAAPGVFAQARYRITDLGTLGGSVSVARGINNIGQVVGESYTNDNDVLSDRAFLYSTGVMTGLGTLGGTSGANGINDQGQVVGWANTTPNNDQNRAFLWSATTRMMDLGTLGGSQSIAYGINNNGQIVGYAATSNEVEHAFLYSAGTMSDLNSLVVTNPGWVLASAAAINDSGDIVGVAISNGWSQAFLYSGGAVTYLDVLPGGYSGRAYGLNNLGQVVGFSTIPGNFMNTHAFLYSGGQMTDLGDLGGAGSFAMGINNQAQVVGWSATTNNPFPAVIHPFLYSGGKLADLWGLLAAHSTWPEGRATCINDNGCIAGYGQNPSSYQHAFVLTPLPSLGIACSGHNVLLSWSTNATGFALFENSDLATTNWPVVMVPPLVTNGQYQVSLPILPDGRQFYRLQSPPSGMALIPAGFFTMGNCMDPNEGYPDELPLHTNYVSAFYMDTNLMSYALWQQVYQWATNHGYDFDDTGSGKAANHPVQSVNWYDVVKWCNARSESEGKTPCYYTDASTNTVYRSGTNDLTANCLNWGANGYRLPTEAEWEKAARGGAAGHRFSWSDADTIDWSRANYYSLWSGGVPYYPYDVNPTPGFPPTFNDGVVPYTSPVGYFAPNGYGLYDMAGNVFEWCWDWYGSYASGSVADPRGPASGLYRVWRGGSWFDGAIMLRTADRAGSGPSGWSRACGFRVVLAPGQP